MKYFSYLCSGKRLSHPRRASKNTPFFLRLLPLDTSAKTEGKSQTYIESIDAKCAY